MAVLMRDIFDDENVVKQLDALCESCVDFFEVHGISRRWGRGEVLLLAQMDPCRHLLGVLAADRSELIGAVEIMAECPCSACVTVASIPLRPEYRTKALGTEILRTLENPTRNSSDATRIEMASWNVTSAVMGSRRKRSRMLCPPREKDRGQSGNW